jgi:hypothetical protein
MHLPIWHSPLTSNSSKFTGNHLTWTVQRTSRNFRAYVVEPRTYDPSKHAAVFEAALTALIAPQRSLVDPFGGKVPDLVGESFDLVTFPEAFLPAERLIVALQAFATFPSFGCIHVGLRPSSDGSHLFTVSELKALLRSLLAVTNIEPTDLKDFDAWLQCQAPHKRFNIGCLFTIDSTERLRVCLHPKLQRSKFEFTALNDGVMEEASLLTVITLKPTDKRYLTISIQPLICSDALLQNTDRPGSRPLEAVHLDADCLGENPPDHIDVVSVAACTPQDESPGPRRYRTWKIAFRDVFQRAVTDASMSRHRFATFVLSNFGHDPNQGPAGLSGAFYPMRPTDRFPTNVSISCWGRPKDEDDPRWSKPAEDYSGWKLKGHIASINPFGEGSNAAVRMFGFTFAALPRDMSLWSPQPAIGNCCIRIGDYAADQSIVFGEVISG